MTVQEQVTSSRDGRTALLSVSELAAYLGVSRWSVYRLVNGGQIRAVRVGERLRFRPSDVDEYLERRLEPVP